MEDQELLSPLLEQEKKGISADVILRAIGRYSVLAVICLMTFGSYYVYDLPGALKDQLMKEFAINNLRYSLMYSLYSWPNTVIALCGGFLVDKLLGIRIGSVVFATLVTIGQIIFAIGVWTNNYWLALVGRFVFGLGGESLAVSQSAYTAKWFKGKELNLAFAITISFSRVGSAVNFNLSPRLAKQSLSGAVFLGALFCIISLVNCLVLAVIDKLRDNKVQKELAAQGDEAKPEEKIRLTDILHFPASIWLIYGIVVAFYVSVFIYITDGVSIIQQNWAVSDSAAATILGLPYTVSSVASPICGLLVDLTGRNLFWMISATSAQTLVHVSLSFFHMSVYVPWVAHVVMGIAYSALAASLWPSVAIILPQNQLGTGYGFAFSLQNLGLAAFPLIAGQLVDTFNNNYNVAEYIFLGCAGVSVLLSIFLALWDRRNPKLNLSGSEIRRRAKLEEEAKLN